MKRRQFITRAAAVLSAVLLPVHSAFAHTPYAQWNIFRKRHLQILTSRADLAGDDVGDLWVEILRDKLPLSRAMVSRAHNMTRIAALLKSDQSKLAVLSYEHAQQMFKGLDQFEEYGQIPLEVLVDDGKYLLVTRSDLPLHHGFLIATTLMGEAGKLHLLDPVKSRFGMSVHAGARAYLNGEKLEMPSES